MFYPKNGKKTFSQKSLPNSSVLEGVNNFLGYNSLVEFIPKTCLVQWRQGEYRSGIKNSKKINLGFWGHKM